MSDKPLVQQGLATDLANMVLRINPVGASTSGAQLSAALAFLEGFWVALVREWNGIDRLRMDKFYMLIRRYVNATFRLLAREGWSSEAVEGVNAILGAQRGPMT
jgi:ribosomal RNA-processing protein 1